MKVNCGIGVCVFGLALWGLAPAAGQVHPSVAPGARETAAAALSRDLGQGKKILIIDVRSPEEFNAGHIPGAVSIPIEELGKRIAEMKVPKDTTIVTVCDHGGRSSRAALELAKLGYKTSSFCRLDAWKKDGYRLEKAEEKARPGA